MPSPTDLAELTDEERREFGNTQVKCPHRGDPPAPYGEWCFPCDECRIEGLADLRAADIAKGKRLGAIEELKRWLVPVAANRFREGSERLKEAIRARLAELKEE